MPWPWLAQCEALSKRWNVQYGLHPRRDPVAVPFQAKGVPSEQAEFRHPDVVIFLMCLSFYYSGLEMVQFERNVQYGLHPRRDPVAVPFQAKGVPSEQAEFRHPDVVILLMCLSFYYSDLEMAQFE